MIRGIDVSRYQGAIDWDKVASAGIKFAFIKATQGSAYVDPCYARNLKEAQVAGVLVGAYHFFNPTRDATRQAKHFLATVGDLTGQLPPVLDIEDAGNLSVKEYQNSIVAWVSHVKNVTGVTPIIYVNLDYLQRFKLTQLLPDCPLWLAAYRDKAPDVSWAFWQHTSSGKVPGIKGNVDLNWFRGLPEEKQLRLLLQT